MRSALAVVLSFGVLSFFGCGGSSAPGGPTAPAATTVVLTASPSPATAGAAVTLSAAVTSSAGTPTGSVTFLEGTTSLGSGTLTNGTASVQISTLAAGTTHSLTATYAGNSSFSASTSATVSLAVGMAAPAATTTALTATPNPAAAGATVTLAASVISSSGTPTGTVTFLDGTASVGTGTLSSGTATLQVTTLAAATTHSLTAVYAGNTTFAASTSSAVSLVVNAPVAASTTSVLIATPNPVAAGSPVMLSVTVSSANGTPAGSVTFLDGTTALGTSALANGVATYTAAALPGGTTQSLTASYAGNGSFAASTSPAVAVVVNKDPAPASITAHATFSFATPNQTIAGFGGSEAFYGSYLDNHPYESEINTALFDPIQGLGLTFLRVQNSYYAYDGTNPTTFDTDTPKIVAAANAAHGSPLTLEMSSWTPPASLKSNNSINGCTTVTNGNCSGGFGTLNKVNGAYNYAGFAQFWYDSLNAYAALGVTPTYISIQNEPDFAASYVACVFNPTEAPVTVYGQTTNYASYGLAFDAVYKKINGGGLTNVPKMIGPETFSIANAAAYNTEVPATELGAIAHHLYNVSSGGLPTGTGTYSTGGSPDSSIPAMTAYNAAFPSPLKFETEYYQTPGFYNAVDIHNDLTVANDNAYFYWGLAWPSTLANGVSVDQAGLIQLDNPFNAQSTWSFPHGWTYNDAYYALKHFSYYIRPGYVRYNATVDNTADERLSVYQSPDAKTTVIVILNTSTTATDGITLNLASINYTSSTVYRSSFATPITASNAERWDNLGSYAATGINLPPQSVVTVVLTN